MKEGDTGNMRALLGTIGITAVLLVLIFGKTLMASLGMLLVPIHGSGPGSGAGTGPGRGGDLNNTDVVFKVEPKENPRYWRMTAYDTYASTKWTQSDTRKTDYDFKTMSPKVSEYASKEEFTYRIEFKMPWNGYVPTASNTVRLFDMDKQQKVVYDAENGFYVQGSVKSYTFTTAQYDYTPSMLTNATVPTGGVYARYCAVPPGVSSTVRALAKNISYNVTSPYEKCLAISSYLRNNYDYTTTSTPQDKDIIENFLATGRGNCEAFASSYVMLCRCNNIPARYVTGFASVR